MKKRSNKVAIVILGAAAFTLAGCQEERVDASAFPDLQSCTASASSGGIFSAQECEASFEQAETLHLEAAPRYDSVAVCEEQHGEGACGSEASATQGGSGSIFMPLMAGYLMGNLLSNRAGQAGSQPLYKNGQGGFTNAARTSSFSSNSGSTKLNASQFARPTATAGKAPLSRATASSRGGFGSSSTSSRSFGG